LKIIRCSFETIVLFQSWGDAEKLRRRNQMNIEIEREEDGRWIAEVPDLPGVMVYGQSQEEAIAKAEALALRVLADRLEHGEEILELHQVFAVPA
jgi:predicted RNase H-like HicB family nuclease